mgnify:CR=1 FL=1
MVRGCPINVYLEDSWRRGVPFDRKMSWLGEVPINSIAKILHHTFSHLPNLLVGEAASSWTTLFLLYQMAQAIPKEKFQVLLRVMGEDEHG